MLNVRSRYYLSTWTLLGQLKFSNKLRTKNISPKLLRIIAIHWHRGKWQAAMLVSTLEATKKRKEWRSILHIGQYAGSVPLTTARDRLEKTRWETSPRKSWWNHFTKLTNLACIWCVEIYWVFNENLGKWSKTLLFRFRRRVEEFAKYF